MGAAKKLDGIDADLVQRVSNIVHRKAGIQLSEKQQDMIHSRLKRRMIDLGMSGAEEYLEYLNLHEQSETDSLVSLITTHHTFFFREYLHFEFLEKNLPEIVAQARSEGRKEIKIWSSACSRGQEAYSLAMFFKVHLPKIAPDFTFSILGTDVDTESVEIAKNAVYKISELKTTPMLYQTGNWNKGTGDISDFVRAHDSIRRNATFALALYWRSLLERQMKNMM